MRKRTPKARSKFCIVNGPLTVRRVRYLLAYNPKTGKLTWKVRQSIRVQIGDEITGRMKQGHLRVSIDYRRYLAHRVAWFHFYGRWPRGRLDHKNTKENDNRIRNLREATHPQNLWNRGAQHNNMCGLKGVSYDDRRDRWFARIMVNGKLHWLGYFVSAKHSHSAYVKAADKLHGEFARAR